MQSLLEEMSALIVKIKAGEASIGELEAFAAGAAQLNERAIVLRYKAYEANVFGNELNQKAVAVIEDIADDGILDQFEIEELSFDENKISDSETDEAFSFDLFADETEQREVKEVKVVKPISEMVPEPIQEEEAEEEIQAEIEEIVVEEVKYTEAVAETNNDSGDLHPIYKRVPTDMNSLSARIWQVRIESLKGAFGFNERMQAVNELFEGSSEAFSSAIEKLDVISDKSTARSQVTSIANQYKWTAESEIGLDFVQKVERKYA